MNYLLDTNAVIDLLNNKGNYLENFAQVDSKNIFLSVVTIAELAVGLNYEDKRSKKYIQTLNFINEIKHILFTYKDALLFGEFKHELAIKGMKIEDTDVIIASIAYNNKLTVITNNTKHFKRIEKLKVENWL